MKQFDPQILLQGMNLMADRGRSHEQLFGCLAEAHVAGGRFEGAQCTQRWDMVTHSDEKI